MTGSLQNKSVSYQCSVTIPTRTSHTDCLSYLEFALITPAEVSDFTPADTGVNVKTM